MQISDENRRWTLTEEGNLFIMRAPDNFHAHFRDGFLLEFVVPVFLSSGWRRRVVAEPNTLPPKLTGNDAIEYRNVILEVARRMETGQDFEPIVTIQITEDTTPATVLDAYAQGVRVCKVYPRYVTTHSEYGVVNYVKIYPALEAAGEVGMVVQFHPEHPSYDVIGRLKEAAFIGILDEIRRNFPKLRISVEHVSSAAMIQWVIDQPECVGASLTIQHMVMTADDLSGYSKRSGGLACIHDALFKPSAKDPTDRDAVLAAAFSGNPKFWYGGDDAPHTKSKKECARSSCGAWNTIPALSMLITLFMKAGFIHKLEAFLSVNEARFYGLPLNTQTITLQRKEWRVPQRFYIPRLQDYLIPFFADELMEWALVA